MDWEVVSETLFKENVLAELEYFLSTGLVYSGS